jgi:hypothetical protein
MENICTKKKYSAYEENYPKHPSSPNWQFGPGELSVTNESLGAYCDVRAGGKPEYTEDEQQVMVKVTTHGGPPLTLFSGKAYPNRS